MIQLPEELEKVWYTRRGYGTVMNLERQYMRNTWAGMTVIPKPSCHGTYTIGLCQKAGRIFR